jgi:hypothetical protein
VRNSAQLFRLSNEFVFLMLGALLVWVALTGHYMFDPRSMAWRLLAGLLALYGLITIRWRAGERTIAWVRGVSIMILGIVMLILIRATIAWVTPLLLIAAGALIVRSLIVSLLVLRSAPKY